jgi:hypothetical protein
MGTEETGKCGYCPGFPLCQSLEITGHNRTYRWEFPGPRIAGFALALQRYGLHLTELGKSPCDRELRQAESTLIMVARI